MTQVVILAGGMGTRLREITGDLPKPLAPVAGTTLLGRQLDLVAASSLKDVVILSGYRADLIADYCGDGSRWGLTVRCIAEGEPRGTAGAVLDALPQLQDSFIVMYGDVVLDVDLDRLVEAHRRHGAAATLLVHPNDHPFDSDIVELDADNYVTRMRGYPHPEGIDLPNLVNAGLYVLERAALAQVADLPAKPDFGKHVFAAMVAQGQRLYGYRSPEYIKDAGTPERLAKTGRDIASGKVAGLSLRTRAPAIFLDRDGVLNQEVGLISRPQDLALYPGVGAAVARINRSAYRSVVITNQPVIARGDTTVEGLAQIHARLDTLLARDHAYVDALYYCPHHPDKGFPGEVSELKFVCECRKPATGLIDRAAEELQIDLGRSWLIGDTTIDVELARRTGVRSILVGTGHAGKDGRFAAEPDLRAPDLAAAVSLILGDEVAPAG
ncbi:MAG: HAD-IIIA family hydrolase [Caulobacterales bacterium]|nr:HAD-IIIA family hydrolase [Caulobacterales bacterium]